MYYKIGVVILSGLAGFLFFVFSHFVRQNRLDNFDFNMMVKIQDRIPASANDLMVFFTLLGKFEVTSLLLLIVIVLLLIKRKWFSVIIPFFFAFGMYIELVGKVKKKGIITENHFLLINNR